MKTLGSITPQTAREILGDCHIPLGSDFHTLPTDVVLDLIDYADNYKYHKPHHANGSRARYFHDALQRRATQNDTMYKVHTRSPRYFTTLENATKFRSEYFQRTGIVVAVTLKN